MTILLVVAGPVVASAGGNTINDVYAAMRIQDLAPASGTLQFVSGDQLNFTSNLVNTSPDPLVVPTSNRRSTPLYSVGVVQTWVLRLGPDPTIPSLSSSGRDGDRYATGGSVITADYWFPDGVIPSGGSLPLSTTTLDTTGFPDGQYRYYVEYKPLASGAHVIQSASLDITNTTP